MTLGKILKMYTKICAFSRNLGFEQLRYRFRGFHGGCATLPADNESCQPTFVHHDETIDVTFFAVRFLMFIGFLFGPLLLIFR